MSSMSKVFSLAGMRLGWIATRNEAGADGPAAPTGTMTSSAAACWTTPWPLWPWPTRIRCLPAAAGIVRENLAVLDDWVRANPHFSYVKPQAGTTALLPL